MMVVFVGSQGDYFKNIGCYVLYIINLYSIIIYNIILQRCNNKKSFVQSIFLMYRQLRFFQQLDIISSKSFAIQLDKIIVPSIPALLIPAG